MNFKQLDHEHVAQYWERMKLMIRNCATHGLNLWMIFRFSLRDRAKTWFSSLPKNNIDSWNK